MEVVVEEVAIGSVAGLVGLGAEVVAVVDWVAEAYVGGSDVDVVTVVVVCCCCCWGTGGSFVGCVCLFE